ARIDVTEADDAVDEDAAGNAEQLRQLGLGHVRGAGADAVVPGGDHHVLGAAAGVELMRLGLRDDDDDGSIGQPASEAAEPGQRAQALAVAHNDQPVGSLFFELPVIRPAWRIRRSDSSGSGLGRKARWSRLSTTAR